MTWNLTAFVFENLKCFFLISPQSTLNSDSFVLYLAKKCLHFFISQLRPTWSQWSPREKKFVIAKKGANLSSNLNKYLNMAWLVGVRKSKIRLSSLVSWLTLMLSPSSDSSSAVTLRLASSICNGNWGSEAETTQICLTWSSTSFCVQPSTFSGDFLTSAWTSTMLSLEILQKGVKSISINIF